MVIVMMMVAAAVVVVKEEEDERTGCWRGEGSQYPGLSVRVWKMREGGKGLCKRMRG